MDEFLFVGGPWGDAFATIGETRMAGNGQRARSEQAGTNTVTSGS